MPVNKNKLDTPLKREGEDDFFGGVLSPSFKVEVKRTTGASDCWNAGYIAARISGLNTEECLTFANTVAAYWIAGQEMNLVNISSIINQSNTS